MMLTPRCGIVDTQNITHCGIPVKEFLPLCGKKLSKGAKTQLLASIS